MDILKVKKCTVCKIEKPLGDFHKKRSSIDGVGYRCRICDGKYSSSWAKNNREQSRENGRKSHYKKKMEVLLYYSKGLLKCSCNGCDITEPLFLTIDHITDGAAHKKTYLGGNNSHLYRWITKNNFPPGFQVLCFNCNCSKRNNEKCPVHSRNEDENK